MADQQNGSSSDHIMNIVFNSPPTIDGAPAWRDGSGQIQSNNAMNTSYSGKSVEQKVENAIPWGEDSNRLAHAGYASAPGEINPGAEGGPAPTKWLINPTFMKVVESEWLKLNAATTSEPFKHAPWPEANQQRLLQMQHTVPLHHQPSPRAPPDISVRATPSSAGASDPDMMRYWRSEGTPGRHHPSGNVSAANELAELARRRSPHHGSSNEYQRAARLTPYDPRHRDTTGTAVLRNSRFVRQPRGNEFESQSLPLTYSAPYNIQPFPTPEIEQFQTLRNILNYGRTPDNSPQTFTPSLASQYTQSPPMVYIPSSLPNLVSMPAPSNTPHSPLLNYPRNTTQYTPHSPGVRPAELFNMRIASNEPEQPLDLSLFPKDPSTFIPISQSSSSWHAEAWATPLTCPGTSTVTSTVKSPLNAEIFNIFDLLPHLPLVTEESNQSTNRTEKEQNRMHRAKTPIDNLPEHLIYKTWPVDNLPDTDHVEEVETTDSDWFDYIGNFDIKRTATTSAPTSTTTVMTSTTTAPTSTTTAPTSTTTVPSTSPASPPCTTSC